MQHPEEKQWGVRWRGSEKRRRDVWCHTREYTDWVYHCIDLVALGLPGPVSSPTEHTQFLSSSENGFSACCCVMTKYCCVTDASHLVIIPSIKLRREIHSETSCCWKDRAALLEEETAQAGQWLEWSSYTPRCQIREHGADKPRAADGFPNCGLKNEALFGVTSNSSLYSDFCWWVQILCAWYE